MEWGISGHTVQRSMGSVAAVKQTAWLVPP